MLPLQLTVYVTREHVLHEIFDILLLMLYRGSPFLSSGIFFTWPMNKPKSIARGSIGPLQGGGEAIFNRRIWDRRGEAFGDDEEGLELGFVGGFLGVRHGTV